MQGDPTWITGTNVTIVKTFNGFAVVQSTSDPATQSLVFANWDDLNYYLAGHFAPNAATTIVTP